MYSGNWYYDRISSTLSVLASILKIFLIPRTLPFVSLLRWMFSGRTSLSNHVLTLNCGVGKPIFIVIGDLLIILWARDCSL